MNTFQFTHWQLRLLEGNSAVPQSFPQDHKWLEAHNPSSPITEIFPDLLHHKLIPDPYIDKNEAHVQWVGHQVWEYRSILNIPDSHNGKTIELVMHGLDTFADVYFNGCFIKSTDNMFTRFTHPVELQQGDNEIRIQFRSVFDVKVPYDPADLQEGIKSRMFVRKAQYHFGWDWGPTLVTCGIYRPVEICIYEFNKINDVYVDYVVKDTATGEVQIQVKTETTGNVAVEYTLTKDEKIIWRGNSSNPSATLRKVDLWYPHTHGTPHLYTLTATSLYNTVTTSVGFRKVELVEDPLDEGTAFFFRVNDIDIYTNGCNWIPASSYLTTITPNDYDEWVNLFKRANQNMSRVWGGGVYECDSFYHACDEQGIMVWQDFMFACGQYPGDAKFTESVSIEASQNIARLRNRPCIVIYAGNNEDYQTIEDMGVPEDQFYAKHIYEQVLPDIITEMYGGNKVSYTFGSPWSRNGLSAADLTTGDVHQWNVWHGKELPYQEWSNLAGRFVSEFGMEAFPTYETFKDFITDEKEMFPQSSTVEMHNKAAGFERKLAMYTFQNIHLSGFQLKDWIYATQFMQSECLSEAVLAFRRRWGQKGKRETGGQLVWQMNDTYPVTSWSIVDHYKRPKLAYYGLKRTSNPIVVGVGRTVTATDGTHRGSSLWKIAPKAYKIHTWVNNLSGESIGGTITLEMYYKGQVRKNSYRKQVVISKNATTECFEVPMQEICGTFNPESTIIRATLHSDDVVFAAGAYWPQPLKHYPQPLGTPRVKILGNQVKITSEYPLKAVYLEGRDRYLRFEDNGFDLFPGEEKAISAACASGLSEDEVCVRYHFDC